jgi:processive 1,2-diacylglycerol beta-glucosyltransferase
MKVFIIYTSAGTGHKKAAEALYQAYKQRGKGQEIEFFNALDYTNSFFKWFYGASYLFMITYLPGVWGFFYFLLDFPPIYFLISPLRKSINFLNSKRLRDKLIKDNPEVVISVHFFASQVVGRLIAKGFLKTKLITVLTDFLPHSFWVNHLTHFYCVAVPQAKERLIQRGVTEEKIKVLGIPISPLFLLKQDKAILRERLNFRQKTFIVLIVSGGFGVGPLEKMLHCLDDSQLDIDLVVVCGRNPFLFKRLKEKNFKKKVNIFGFVNNMHEIMKASDLIITKSGGLSISEALACKLPILIVHPVPGQETRNCFILTQHRLAIKIKNLKDLQTIILKLMKDEIKQEYLKNIRAISHPQAAFDIIEFADSIG